MAPESRLGKPSSSPQPNRGNWELLLTFLQQERNPPALTPIKLFSLRTLLGTVFGTLGFSKYDAYTGLVPQTHTCLKLQFNTNILSMAGEAAFPNFPTSTSKSLILEQLIIRGILL